LGYLAWAACGKDPGFSPTAIVELAARSARYSEAEPSPASCEAERAAPARRDERLVERIDECPHDSHGVRC
jgi:hypothetical protein